MTDSEPNREISLDWQNPETGKSENRTLSLPITFGRHPDCTLVLSGEKVSRHHAMLEMDSAEIVLTDLGSKNGTRLNNKPCERVIVHTGDVIQIGDHRFTVSPVLDRTISEEFSSGLVETKTQDQTIPDVDSTPAFPPTFFDEKQVSIKALYRSELPLRNVEYATIGGGLGSFIWADYLRVHGVPTDQITAIGSFDDGKPYGNYRQLCRYSQIPDHERLRSNSDSCPDNLWGWPGYAVREAWHSLLQGDLKQMAYITWQIFGEPTLAETYTPRSGNVFASIDREATRIGWNDIWQYGRVRAIRKTDDDRYVVAYSQTTNPEKRVHKFLVAKYLHIAVGYPAIRLLDDLKKYRDKTRDLRCVVNAYEDHDHIYDYLSKYGGTVMIRGRGIVASRVIQRVYEVRQQRSEKDVNILHLVRSPIIQGHGYKRAQRFVKNHWEFQPFNWPKACWGGDLRKLMAQVDSEEQQNLLKQWGGTTTADRKDWQDIIETGQRERWYRLRFGNVDRVDQQDNGKLLTKIHSTEPITEQIDLTADFIIDGTGLISGVDQNPLLKDLIEHYELGYTPAKYLKINNDFEVLGMANGTGRVFASGIATLQGPYAPVDSFLGLQYAAQCSVDALVRSDATNIKYLNGPKSVWQWLRWAGGVRP